MEVILFERKNIRTSAGIQIKTKWTRVAKFKTKVKANEYIEKTNRKKDVWEYRYEAT
jgi:hypothetical protein